MTTDTDDEIIVQEFSNGEWWGMTSTEWYGQNGNDVRRMRTRHRCTPDAGIIAVLNLMGDGHMESIGQHYDMNGYELYFLHPDHVVWHDEEVL